MPNNRSSTLTTSDHSEERLTEEKMVFLVVVAQKQKNISKIAIHTQHANENLLPNVMVVVVVFTIIMNTFVYPYEARTDMWTVFFFLSSSSALFCRLSIWDFSNFGNVVYCCRWCWPMDIKISGNRRLTEPNFRAALIKRIARHIQHGNTFSFCNVYVRGIAAGRK